MMSAPPGARRLRLFGCALLGAVALTLSACGGEGTTTDESVANQPRETAVAAPGGKRCRAQVSGFLASMDTLRKRLEVGVTYEEYVDEMAAVRSTYDAIPVERLQIECLTSAGPPGERALNEYIDAANAWGECLAEVGCDAAAIEPRLQGEWRVAAHFLLAAQRELRGLRAAG
jgi:hypothetical protein